MDFKDELSKKVLGYLSNIEQLVESELPSFVNEYLQYLMVSDVYSNIFGVIFSLIMLIIGAVLVFLGIANNNSRGLKKIIYDNDMEPPCIGIGTAIIICFSMFFLITTYEASMNYFKLTNSPKVYLMEHFRK